MMNDHLVPLAVSAQGRYSAAFLDAIDAGLAVRPENRPQDIAALRARLMAHAPVDGPTAIRLVDSEATVLTAPTGRGDPTTLRPSAPTGGGAATVTTRDAPVPLEPIAPIPLARPEKAEKQASKQGGKRPLLLAGLAALVLAGGAAWYVTGDTRSSAASKNTSNKVVRAAVPKDSLATAPAPVVAAQAVPTSPVAAPAVAAEPRATFSPIAGLDEIVRHSDPLISVNAMAKKARLVIDKDPMQFNVKSSEAGYLYVFSVGAKSDSLQRLLPNGLDQDNYIAANTTVNLPRKSWPLVAAGPAGMHHLVVMVSRAQRDFSAAGLKSGEEIPSFDFEQARQAWASAPGNKAVFAGEVRCPSGDKCDASYGAALILIEEVLKGSKQH
jgi:hypothetical protein